MGETDTPVWLANVLEFVFYVTFTTKFGLKQGEAPPGEVKPVGQGAHVWSDAWYP